MQIHEMTFEEALSSFDRSAAKQEVEEAEKERVELVRRFPIDAWPTMALGEYALGQGTKDCFCWWAEQGAKHAGSMGGGYASKHLIFKKAETGEWSFDRDRFKDEQEAWISLRSGFLKAFGLAKNGDWDAIDQIQEFAGRVLLRTKTLYCYFPDELLPISSRAAMLHFLQHLGDADGDGSPAIPLNRRLLALLRQKPQLAGWTTKEMERLLYYWCDPRDQKSVVKVAPGEGAEHWEDCLAGGYICVGWDSIGDIREFDADDKADFKKKFAELYLDDLYNGNRGKCSKKGNELWKFYQLEPGDLIVANKGKSEILAVGEVIEPAYEWRDDRPTYKHTVKVKWDTAYAQSIPEEGSWAFCAVADVSQALATRIFGGRIAKVDQPNRDIAASLDEKRQAILFGPPGTGKTFAARRFAVWWLLKDKYPAPPDALTDWEGFKKAERLLCTPDAGDGIAPLTMLTFHASYSYEDFVEGYRPVDSNNGGLSLKLEDGIFKRICRAAQKTDRPYLVLIDEINRANVAKVLGEVITVLERDKRGMPIVLPQSKEQLVIPPNLFLLGTMNTADRSIKLLDAALRRRFAFIEMMPDMEPLGDAVVGDLILEVFLRRLNQTIARKLGREKQIGHSFLLLDNKPITDPAVFARRFRHEILPLLQEYCYDDFSTLAMYVGNEVINTEERTLNEDCLDDPKSLLAALQKHFGEPTP